VIEPDAPIIATEDINALFKNKGIVDVFDVIKNWNCKFEFTKEEAIIWKEVDFYAFLFGRKVLSIPVGRPFKAGWQSTKIYKTGLIKLKQLINRDEPKPKSSVPRWVEKVQKYANYYYLEEIEKYFNKSYIFIGKKRYKVRLPLTVKGSRYRPKPGFNPSFAAKKHPYKYTLNGRVYLYGWSRARNFRDVTKVLQGLEEYPIEIKMIHFDLNMNVTELGAYPFLLYLIKYKLKYASYERYVDYISQRITT